MQLDLTHNERLLLILGLGAINHSPAQDCILAYKSEPEATVEELAKKLIEAGNGSRPAEMPELQVSGSSGVTQPHPNNASASAMTSAPLPENNVQRSHPASEGRSAEPGRGGFETNSRPPSAPLTWWAKPARNAPEYSILNTEEISVKPSKIEPKPTAEGTPRLMVTWQNQGKGFSRASVWDEQLFPKVKDREGKPTTFFVTRKGQWVNIVGVRY